MRIMAVDKQGNQHCWKCGGQGFTHERVPRATDVLGVRSTFTTPMLRCVHCGEYNDVGAAMEYA